MNDQLKLFEPPKNNPPKQRLPGWIRWPLRILAFPIMILDVYSQKFAYMIFKPKYKLEGSCKKRGTAATLFIWDGLITINLNSHPSLSFYVFLAKQRFLGFYFRSFDFVVG